MVADAIRQLGREEFPPLFNEIPDPPEELYLEGVLPSAEKIYLTVVGSRKFSRYGAEAGEKIISGLAGQPIVIVSGLALGIDTIAHKAALNAGLATVAIPGSGLSRAVLHPHSNRLLADRIVAAGGALLSEFPPDYPAGLHTFPRRNRLMAGIAKAVLIVEAGDKSGTLITARLAADYNRDVLVVPGSIFSPQSAGTNQLLRQGAAAVTSAAEVLEALGFSPSETPRQNRLLLENLSPTEKQVVGFLAVEALSRDELIRKLALPTSETNVLLAAMEIKGLIKETMGEINLIF